MLLRNHNLRVARLVALAFSASIWVIPSFAASSVSTKSPTIFGPKPVDDGKADAPAGVAPQHPNLLSGYTKRPAWGVAGVDYGVGYPTATVFTDWLKWALARPSSITIRDSRNSEVVGGDFTGKTPPYVLFATAPVTVDGVDFTKSAQGCATLRFSSNYSKSIVRNSKFACISNADYISTALNTSGDLTITKNVFDGLSPNTGKGIAGYLITINGGGSVVITYNWIKNPSKGMIHWLANGTTDSYVERYNLKEFSATFAPGAHMGSTSWGGNGRTVTAAYDFNTVTSQPNTCCSAGGEYFKWYFGNSTKGAVSIFLNPSFQNNVMISNNPNSNSYMVRGLNSINGNSDISGSGIAANNYADPRGTILTNSGGVFVEGPHSKWPLWKFVSNINMVTGAEIPAPNFPR